MNETKEEEYFHPLSAVTRKFVSICIPLWKKDEYYFNLIKSIKKYDAGVDYEICVSEGKNSVAQNRNLAMSKAKSPYICMLDSDCQICQDGWLASMLEILEIKKDSGIVGCLNIYPKGEISSVGGVIITNTELANKRIDELLNKFSEEDRNFVKNLTNGDVCIPLKNEGINYENKIYIVDYVPFPCCLFDRRKTGLFLQEIYGNSGFEDNDFCYRCLGMGLKNYVDGRVKIIHPTKDDKNKEPDEKNLITKASNYFRCMVRWGIV